MAALHATDGTGTTIAPRPSTVEKRLRRLLFLLLVFVLTLLLVVFRQQLLDHFFDLGLAIAVTIDGGDDLAVLILANDAVGLELGILDLFDAVAGADFHRFDVEVFAVLLLLVIHDDRNLGAEHSPVEVVVGQ